MAARGDFWCITCDEVMELPLKASACPVCAGLLERRFTAPMVNTDHAKRVDAIAEPVLHAAPSGQRPPAPQVPENARTRILAPAAAIGMVQGPNRAASQSLNTSVIRFASGKGPRPIPGV